MGLDVLSECQHRRAALVRAPAFNEQASLTPSRSIRALTKSSSSAIDASTARDARRLKRRVPARVVFWRGCYSGPARLQPLWGCDSAPICGPGQCCGAVWMPHAERQAGIFTRVGSWAPRLCSPLSVPTEASIRRRRQVSLPASRQRALLFASGRSGADGQAPCTTVRFPSARLCRQRSRRPQSAARAPRRLPAARTAPGPCRSS